MSWRAPSLNRVLDAAPELSALAEHAARLSRLQDIYARTVPDYLAEVSRVANLKLSTLIIHADNAAVATKLKQLEPRLRTAFAGTDASISALQFKVQPARPQPPRPSFDRDAHLSEDARNSLEGLSSGLPEDSPVRRALKRFLNNAG
ncbi:MAG: DciA family protein [Rhodocyclaceae bacterium]|nr:DciA family protein [Rhodocyclaceae bacterium]